MERQELIALQNKANQYGLEIREDELIFLVGFIVSQVHVGINEIDQQIGEIDAQNFFAPDYKDKE